jgi:hypothetical protein
LTLAEAKHLLARVQQDVVAAQADIQAMLRPNSRSCAGTCVVKNWRAHRIATLFDEAGCRFGAAWRSTRSRTKLAGIDVNYL